jgi:hypothetical protein
VDRRSYRKLDRNPRHQGRCRSAAPLIGTREDAPVSHSSVQALADPRLFPTTVIDFESLSDLTIVDDQFQSLGVDFHGDATVVARASPGG